MERIIFHIDANNAFLSWTACDMLENGCDIDIRNIASAIAGDKAQRSGIILAKSELAKKCGVKTAETIGDAKRKCKNIQFFKPDYKVYKKYSDNMYKILSEYSDKIERYSIDECFLDYTYMQKLYGNPLDTAKLIQNRIYNELGFTVNIGIGNNRLLAKMASELEKPNKINTIYSNEIKEKMWNLPVNELFMVGRHSVGKLHSLGIYKIGELATFDKQILINTFKKFGIQMWEYANGIDDTEINGEEREYKGIGNSITTVTDIDNKDIAHKNILSLCEYVCRRLRKEGMYTQCISVSIKTNNFETISHQRKLSIPTDITKEIYIIAVELFNEIWKGQKLRSFGVRLDKLTKKENEQINLFSNMQENEKRKKMDKVLDNTRSKFGNNIIKRASLLETDITKLIGKE